MWFLCTFVLWVAVQLSYNNLSEMTNSILLAHVVSTLHDVIRLCYKLQPWRFVVVCAAKVLRWQHTVSRCKTCILRALRMNCDELVYITV